LGPERVEDGFDRQLKRQQREIEAIHFISPSGCLLDWIMLLQVLLILRQLQYLWLLLERIGLLVRQDSSLKEAGYFFASKSSVV